MTTRIAIIVTAVEKHGRYADLSDLLAEMVAAAGAPTRDARAWAPAGAGP